MNNMITKLSSVAALIGVIGAIGAGFVQYGKLTAKIEELDEREAVINQTVDLEPLQEKISVLEVQLIDRIKKVDDKIVVVDLSGIKEDITELKGRSVNLKPLNDAIKELENAIAELKQEVAIVKKENQLQDILIEEIKEKGNNPLAN
jgi:hypothetical protein|tara:strand:- start:14 stop:454 length:441 start_codon:yes stop_codon:yes gene_type:complete